MSKDIMRGMLASINLRRKEVKSNSSFNTNCHSASFYMAGLIEEDRYIYGEKVNSLVDVLREKEVAKAGYLVVFEVNDDFGNKELIHSGLIVNEDPLLVCNRRGVDKKVYDKEPLEDLVRFYEEITPKFKVRFYEP